MGTQSDGLRAEVFIRALAGISSPVSVADALVSDLPLVYVNPAFEVITGYSAADALGRNCRFLQGRDTDESAPGALRAALEAGRPSRVVVRNYRPDGSPWWNEVALSPVHDAAGTITHWIGLQQDVTDRVLDEERLHSLAYRDELTGVPNRTRLREHLELALARADRHRTAVAVLFLDLDGFKEVNDRHGHAAGDDVLRVTAQRLSRVVRATDLLARHGGDEFVLLVADLPRGSAKPAVTVVERQLRQALTEPVVVGGGPSSTAVQVQASIGTALYPDDAHDPEALLSAADAAMYAAKRTGPWTAGDRAARWARGSRSSG